MNTQEHIIIGTTLFTKKNDLPPYILFAILGSIFPDITMAIFVVVESLIKQTPPIMLWTIRYYDPSWQFIFNVFNSIPLAIVLIMIGMLIYKRNIIASIVFKHQNKHQNKYQHKNQHKTQLTTQPKHSSRGLLIFGEAILLHDITDFFLHHDDGHAHFLPFSDFVFQSPLSYWDIRHYAYIVSPIIGIISLIACIVLYKRAEKKSHRIWMLIIIMLMLTIKIVEFTMMDNFVEMTPVS